VLDGVVPLTKCSTLGLGIVIFGVACAMLFRNVKCASIGWSDGKSIFPVTAIVWAFV
jgi:multisubunit Na+/H+ antiporter MnhG subunit